LGELSQAVDPAISIELDETKLEVKRSSDAKDHRSKHGLYRALINNMVVGVSEGFTTEQELVGVGYRASNTGQLLELSLGYSHNIVFEIPKEFDVEIYTNNFSRKDKRYGVIDAIHFILDYINNDGIKRGNIENGTPINIELLRKNVGKRSADDAMSILIENKIIDKTKDYIKDLDKLNISKRAM
jgi:hypothetical protein